MRIAVFADRDVGARVLDLLSHAHGVEKLMAIIDPQSPAPPVVPGGIDRLEFEGDDGVGLQSVLSAAEVDLGLLAWWPRIVRPGLLRSARLGFLNLHPSLLPFNRGKDPNFWAIVDRRPFGVTIHWVDTGVDTGPIAFQRELTVDWTDTGASLYSRATEAIVELLSDSLPAILGGQIPREPQRQGTLARRRQELDPASVLDLDAPTTARSVLDLLRARTFPPHPGVRFSEDGHTYQVRVSIERVTGESDR
jgi:methionyl-tRNA formyltransferase